MKCYTHMITARDIRRDRGDRTVDHPLRGSVGTTATAVTALPSTGGNHRQGEDTDTEGETRNTHLIETLGDIGLVIAKRGRGGDQIPSQMKMKGQKNIENTRSNITTIITTSIGTNTVTLLQKLRRRRTLMKEVVGQHVMVGIKQRVMAGMKQRVMVGMRQRVMVGMKQHVMVGMRQ